MYYKGYHINVIILDNAYGVPGSIHKNDDDSYSIFIDGSLSYEKQRKTFLHEMTHIFENDFEKNDVQEIESMAHQFDVEFSNELCVVI